MAGDGFLVLLGEASVRPRKPCSLVSSFLCVYVVVRTLKSTLCFADSQLSGLLEGAEGLVNSGDGVLVWVDVEVGGSVVNELEEMSFAQLFFDTKHTSAG